VALAGLELGLSGYTYFIYLKAQTGVISIKALLLLHHRNWPVNKRNLKLKNTNFVFNLSVTTSQAFDEKFPIIQAQHILFAVCGGCTGKVLLGILRISSARMFSTSLHIYLSVLLMRVTCGPVTASVLI
jgi:hypothetical protein